MTTDSYFESSRIIGRSQPIREVFRLVKRVASSDTTIIINGETGTGKGLIARAIHDLSRRKDSPFVTINCGAIPENLLESELFGHVRGAFTGATANKTGKFETARGGTVFLDEIGDMSADLQVKILRVLEEREFEPVGGNKTVRSDVRILAATHRDLEEAVQKGAFREDLFYRLYVIPITLPALRDRKSDILLMAAHFLERFNRKNSSRVEALSDEALEIMTRHNWPGNVRELKNMMERLVVLKGEGRIFPEDLPAMLRQAESAVDPPKIEISEDGICLNTAVSEFEKSLIIQSMEKSAGVKNQAAKLLHVNRTTLVEKIKRHKI
ncbi:MAG: sigma-54-dependent Fis family transcriptional regulator [Desulfobacterales bacterium]|nr:sigma-54-dependent Fis family transcriptional regulator [Desulfobacterales bacterium]